MGRRDNATSRKTLTTGNYTHWYQTIHNLQFCLPTFNKLTFLTWQNIPGSPPFSDFCSRVGEPGNEAVVMLQCQRCITKNLLFSNTENLDVAILCDELSNVRDWYQLGIKLGVPDYKLDEIQRTYPVGGVSRWRVEALSLWLQLTPNGSWRNVIRALQRMGQNILAERIRHKYIRGAPSGLLS